MKFNDKHAFIATFTIGPLLKLLPAARNKQAIDLISIQKKLRRLFIVFLLAVMSSLLFAQDYPPAQGPPNTTTPGGLPTSIIIALVQAKIQQVVDSANAFIRLNKPSTSVQATVSFSKTVHPPGISLTDYPDRPNQRVVRIYFGIDYSISGIKWHGIPYFSRGINQSITVDVSCNNWFTTEGAVKIATRVDQPYLDENSFGEEVLDFFIGHRLTDYVDSKIRSMLPPAFQAAINLPAMHCNCLGVSPGTGPGYLDGEIRYSYVPPPFKISTPYNTVYVTLQSIKRLNARDGSGDILYNTEEDIQLEVYANQVMRSTVLDNMVEGETRPLNTEPITLKRPKDDELLVLIGTIWQLPTFEDTRFVIFKNNVNFGNGVQTITVQKTYWQRPFRLPNGHMSKPVQMKVNAYEIKVKVQATLPLVNAIGPIANAGNDLSVTLPINLVTLNGTASSAADGIISKYSWTKISGPSQYKTDKDTAAKAQLSGLVAGTYTFKLKVTDTKGSANEDTVVVKVLPATKPGASPAPPASSLNSTGPNVPDAVNESDLSVYPNPVSTVLKIMYKFKNTADVEGKIYDVQGKIVKTAGFTRQKGSFYNTINVSSLPAGVYFLELKFENGVAVIKQFIKK